MDMYKPRYKPGDLAAYGINPAKRSIVLILNWKENFQDSELYNAFWLCDPFGEFTGTVNTFSYSLIWSKDYALLSAAE